MAKCFDHLKLVALAILVFVGGAIEAKRADAEDLQTAILAGGCFWCVEADFEKVQGVVKAVSGYTGGTVANPTYKQVTKGGTGHYEAVKITYDADLVGYDQLIHMFFRSVDPTDAGGQFCDRGQSYATAVFVGSEEERAVAERAKRLAKRKLRQTIATPILDAGAFYPAEDYHQDYYRGNKLIVTRFGPKRQHEAYKRYREACGRDARVKELWGSDAPFVGS